MSNHREQDLLNQLQSELQQAEEYRPGSEQDAIFQENLERQQLETKTYSSVKHPWFAAAMAILVIGIVAVVGQNYLDQSRVSTVPMEQLIHASNEIESELSGFDVNQLETSQYIAVIKLRDEISQLDSRLNELYQQNGHASEQRLQELWQRRLEMARNLKALYTNHYVVARI